MSTNDGSRRAFLAALAVVAVTQIAVLMFSLAFPELIAGPLGAPTAVVISVQVVALAARASGCGVSPSSPPPAPSPTSATPSCQRSR